MPVTKASIRIDMRTFLKAATFKTLYFVGTHDRLRKKKQQEGRITALCLHSVSTDFDYFFDPIKPDRFEELVWYVLKHYEVIAIDSVGGKTGNKPKLILSFDDGYYDFYSNVLPVLKHYSLPSNHNVVTDIVSGRQNVIWTEKLNLLFNYFRQNKPDDLLVMGGDEYSLKKQELAIDTFYITVLKKMFQLQQAERESLLTTLLKKYKLEIIPKKMMCWDEIRECVKYGVDIGSHTKRHSVLTGITDEKEMYEELAESKAEIEKNLGKSVLSLAPPNGLCNHSVLSRAAAVGYKYVLGIGEHSYAENSVENITFLSRLNLISEPKESMILRIEELQSNLKKYGRV